MSFKSFIFRVGAKASKHAPTALVLGGIAVGVAAGIVATRRGIKLHEVITDDKKQLERIKQMEEDPTARFVVEEGATDDEPTIYAPYDKDVADNDRKEVVRHMTQETIKAYALPVGLGLLAVTMIFAGYRMKCTALAAMTTAYNASVAALKTYRKRVADRFGEDVEREIYLGKQTEVLESTDEDGNMKVEEVVNYNPIDVTVRIDDTNKEFRNDQRFMRDWLATAQNCVAVAFNSHATKHVYAYEVLDILGVEREEYPQLAAVGYSEKTNPERSSIDLVSNAYFVEEDGVNVLYVPLDFDGVISI